MSDLEQSAREAERATLDIDEVAADAVERPDLPAPSLTLSDIDLALNQTGILPAGAEWRRLDAVSYALRLPGMDHEARATTQAALFDDHFESHQFLSPGGPLFDLLAADCLPADEEGGKPPGEGKIWRLFDRSTGACRYLVRRRGAVMVCNSLSEVLDAVAEDSAASPLDVAQLSQNEEACQLA